MLFIDTSRQDRLTATLVMDKTEVKIEEEFDFKKSQGLLPLIERLLFQEGLKPQEITQISVNPGPGSFTGIRVGVAIANTLGLMLQVSVNGGIIGKPVEPVYE